jgi:hypothetical protein
MRTYHVRINVSRIWKKVMTSFLSDWWEAFVISGCYEMGDPLAPSEVEGNRESRGTGRGEACPPLAGFTRS